MRTVKRLSIIGMVMSALLLAMPWGMAAIQVELNGHPVALSVEPISVVNRTMVPMRSIFEALGARVQWTQSTQTITATKAATVVQLTIGEMDALVNGQTVALDVPAMIHRGSTMVPLRFVSESLGADVRWSEATQTVSIFTDGTPYSYQQTGTPYSYQQTGTPYSYQLAAMQTASIPMGTVIPVALDGTLNSSTSKAGDGFRVTVVSNQNGDAEFPIGTHLAGTVVGVQKASATEPGILDLRFREVQLPDGSVASIDGSLISLDDKSVTRSADGRLVATVKPASDDRLKMIGIGVGAGLIIGKLLDQNLIVGGLLGAAAGYFYNEYTKDKVKPTDVVVNPGTVFGVRMDRDASYSAPSAYATARIAYLDAH